jgi:protein-disulfide isomerase
LPYSSENLCYLHGFCWHGRKDAIQPRRNDQERNPVTDRPSLLPYGRPLTRRRLVKLAAGLAALSAASQWGLSVPALAQRKKAAAVEVPLEELMKPGPLPDLVVGSADAPITVVEYASMTCGHCAAFHNNVFPKLKEKYVDTGKVRFIMREFPLDNLAAAASMLARCAGEGKTYPMITVLFAKQDDWAFVRTNPVPELFKFAKQAGFTQESFDKCLADQKLLDDITAARARAVDVFGVNSTPTFFINGKKLVGGSLEDFEKAFEPILKS